MSSLNGKVALVTGGARGIGLATARLLLQNKAKVVIVDIDSSEGKTSCTELQAEFSDKMVKFYEADVSNMDDLKTVFVKTFEDFGQLDIVCNIAGILDADWKRIMEVNLMGSMSGTFLGIDHMSTEKGGTGGVIINMASLAGLLPFPELPVYTASKHGIVGFTRSMVHHATKDAVRINCICPGLVMTKLVDQLPAGNTTLKEAIETTGQLEPEDVAEVVLELVNDTSKVGAVVLLTGHGKKYLGVMDRPDLAPNTDSQ